MEGGVYVDGVWFKSTINQELIIKLESVVIGTLITETSVHLWFAALRHGLRHVSVQRNPVTMATSEDGCKILKCICTVIVYMLVL